METPNQAPKLSPEYIAGFIGLLYSEICRIIKKECRTLLRYSFGGQVIKKHSCFECVG